MQVSPTSSSGLQTLVHELIRRLGGTPTEIGRRLAALHLVPDNSPATDPLARYLEIQLDRAVLVGWNHIVVGKRGPRKDDVSYESWDTEEEEVPLPEAAIGFVKGYHYWGFRPFVEKGTVFVDDLGDGS